MIGRRREGASLVVILVAAIVSACAHPLSPQEVTDRFWRAVTVQSAAKMRRYVRLTDRARLEGDARLLPVSAYRLGRIVIDGDRATVETRVTLAGDEPLDLEIDTLLVREDGQWRVNYASTIERISLESDLARVIDRIERFGDALKNGIDRSVEEMDKALPEIQRQLLRIEDEIKQRVPELRRRLEEFSRRIEEALEPEASQETPEPPVEPVTI